jgi:hypothetical protein
MIYKWYVKLTSLRDRGFIYHDMSLISLYILWFVIWTLSWYVAILYHDILRRLIIIYHRNISWYTAIIYHDILRWYIMIYCDDISWYIAMIYHDMSKRSRVSLSKTEKLSFFSFGLWDIVTFFKNIFQWYIMIY